MGDSLDDIGRKSGHLMLITPERVFYAGLLGRPRARCSGGFNIYASDLESVLLQHPAVREAAVIGIPSEVWGETPWAVAVLHDGCSADADEIRAWANARLDRMQRLAGVEIRPALPRSEIGKVLKQELRAAYLKPASMGMER